jgi:hypothetical protein
MTATFRTQPVKQREGGWRKQRRMDPEDGDDERPEGEEGRRLIRNSGLTEEW